MRADPAAATPRTHPDWRSHALQDPETILDDPDLMRALSEATDRRMGPNVVDMRGLAMEQLERRLLRLEDTHRAVVANAYDNLAGTNQIHRCVLAMLAAPDLPAFLDVLDGEATAILRVASLRLVVEATGPAPHPAVIHLPEGDVALLLDADDAAPPRAVTLRAEGNAGTALHRVAVGSEALLALDLGPGRVRAALALGALDPDAFRPGQGTDLLAFLGACTARLLARLTAAP